MNKRNIKSLFLGLITLMSFMTSCTEDVDIDVNNGDKFGTGNGTQAIITSQDGLTKSASTSFRGNSTFDLYIQTNKPVTADATGKIVVDESFLATYNSANSTSYTLLPTDIYTIADGGAFTIASGTTKSGAVSIAFNNKTDANPGTIYAIPFNVEFSAGDVTTSGDNSKFLLLVQDNSAYPGPGNKNGIKIISCMEINDVNPLNNLSFTLKETGQPLFDMVILFSSNVNYDAQTARPYISHNTEMTNILANTAKYIKPLQDRGIKVMLSLLGNWDRAGIANMDEATAKLFAQEIKNTLDVYNLDGVMFDDEYTQEVYPAPPGFVDPSSAAAGRLMYETKKAIGDKLTMAYIYNRLNGEMPTFDGMDAGQYVDYALSDYLQGPVSDTFYPGMTNKQKAPYSQEFAQGRFLTYYNSWGIPTYEDILKEGYGAHMIFALNPNVDNFPQQIEELKIMSPILCGDEVVYDGVVYKTDYK